MMLACPACHTLVHTDRLRELARDAERAKAAGDLRVESAIWQQALDLLPPSSAQFATIKARVTEIAHHFDKAPATPLVAVPAAGPWYRKWGAALVAIAVLLLTKGKFLILGLTKAKTLLSMFAFFGVYWSVFGWPFALGIVLTIYVHEMGHVYVLRKLGIESSAPMFIPGVGAFILAKRHLDDPRVDARVGLAGPIWGLGAAVICYAVYRYTGSEIWGAIAAVTGFINLFNLTPIWQLDGSRGFHALTRWQRMVAFAGVVIAFYLTGQKMLLLVGAVALFRMAQRGNDRSEHGVLATYLFLIFALSLLSISHATGP